MNWFKNKKKYHLVKKNRTTKTFHQVPKQSESSYPTKVKQVSNHSTIPKQTAQTNFSNTFKLEKLKNSQSKKFARKCKLTETNKVDISKLNVDLSFNQSIKNNIYDVRNLSVSMNKKTILHDITVKIADKKITSLVGPSGAGKSTFLNTLNRLIELKHKVKVTGEIFLHGNDIFNDKVNVYRLRQKVGMVFQQPTPFPMSIFDNIAYGPRIHGIKNKVKLTEIVKWALQNASLYDEVADNLKDSALDLSGGQKQRLCIARVLAVKPQVLLLDEPTSSLDPIATVKIEELIFKLSKHYSIILITHSIQQTLRCSHYTMFFYKGRVIDYNNTRDLFSNPKNKITKVFIDHASS